MLRTRRSRSGPAPPSAMKRAVWPARRRGKASRAHTPPPAAGPRSRRVPAARGGPASRPGAGPDHGRAADRRLALPGGSAPLRCPPRPAAPAPRPGARAAPASRVAIRDRSRRRRTAAPVAASAPGFARRWRPAKACPARKRPHGPAARAPRPAGRGQSRRFRRMQRPLLARLQQAAAAHRHGPGREGAQHDQDQQQRAPAGAPAARDGRAALPPRADLGPQGTGDEPHDFHQEKKDAQGLDEEVIDQGRDAQEQDQAVDPGGPGEQDQPAPPRGGKCSGAGSPSANSRSRRSQRASAKARACRFGICRKSDSRK